ncbi:arylsulfatase A-like enzyme [Thermomonospora umbrina]|uniref:Arylsulfatase A-like enzyme n=1 Tax=Thermomonospora umbrina TaxID=111806 RepID=A0A3D9SWD5_9ACTN|nr:arylsulfatase A-like enzyme [Thermomonospora umbrina]
MGRRTVLVASAATAAVAGLCGGSARPVTGHRRPNVLLIVTDDQPLGTGWAIPAVRGLVGGHGVTYPRAYATTPLCGPSRASVLTGRYAHHHGVLQNGRPWPGRLDQRTTLPHHLRAAGYRTAMFGKYINGWDVHQAPPGFDEFSLMQPPKYGDASWNVNGTVAEHPAYTTSLVRDGAVDFLRRQRDSSRPWFLYVAPYAPHKPFTPEERYARLDVPPWEGNPAVDEDDREGKPAYIRSADATEDEGRDIRRGQLRTLRSVDDMFRALHHELAEQGRLRDTLIIVVSDNGYCWGDYGWKAKSIPYGPSTRVPLFLSWPGGGFGRGVVDGRLVANIDIAPTILDATGVRPLTPLDGRSLLRSGSRDRLLLEWWKQGDRQAGHSWASTVTPDYQYIEHYDLRLRDGLLTGQGDIVHREYYDLRGDHHQLRNLLHEAPPDLADRLNVAWLSTRLAADRGVLRPIGA